MRENVARVARWMRRDRPSRKDLWRALGARFPFFERECRPTRWGAGAVGRKRNATRTARRGGRTRSYRTHCLPAFPVAFLRTNVVASTGLCGRYDWRRWLVRAVSALNFSTWRRYAAGDLLERALADTDELQNLWLRFLRSLRRHPRAICRYRRRRSDTPPVRSLVGGECALDGRRMRGRCPTGVVYLTGVHE